jgi:hypothetical protein
MRMTAMRYLALVLFFCLLAPSAWADSGDAAAAEALFSEGKRLMDEGKYAEACPKLAESQRLDPGTGTLLNLATCYENAGQVASAWSTWLSAASSARTAGQSDREILAREQATALEPKLGRLTIVVPPEKRPQGLTVERDGVALSHATWGTALPTDAGEHRIVVKAPGYEPYETAAIVVDGQAAEITIPELVKAPEPPPAPAEAAPAAVPADQGAGSTTRTLGYVLGGVGIVGLGVGTVFGILAINTNDQSKAECLEPAYTSCNADGVTLRNQAMTYGNVSTVAIIAGAALTATGAVLVITSPKKRGATAAKVEPMFGGARLVLSGAF